ncbi:MAG: glycolate oxidase subunit GlcE [Pseudomonadales bacterium]
MGGGDRGEELCEALRDCRGRGASVRIVGSGSKSFLTAAAASRTPDPPALSTTDHSGVLDYRPEELVITARAGTPLREVERQLAEADQQLPFEPPRFHGGGTLGGAVACGLSGPGRPWRGSVRDAVLGVELCNGLGERLRFGGQVMKNVAGYDVSRLQVGAFGTLGLLLAISVKVLPRPAAQETRTFEVDAGAALELCRRWAARPYPITATCFLGGLLRVRLAGAEPALRAAATALGGDRERNDGFWDELRDQRLSFFAEPGLWRGSLPPAAAAPLDGCLVTWGGGERWWRPPDPAAAAALLAAHGGHGRPFDDSFGLRVGRYVPAVERHYGDRLRRAFDPDGVLNPDLSVGQPTARARRDAD